MSFLLKRGSTAMVLFRHDVFVARSSKVGLSICKGWTKWDTEIQLGPFEIVISKIARPVSVVETDSIAAHAMIMSRITRGVPSDETNHTAGSSAESNSSVPEQP
jgi:hypothetical protein